MQQKIKNFQSQIFFHFLPVLLTSLIALHFRLSPQIFIKRPGETDSWKKPEVKNLVLFFSCTSVFTQKDTNILTYLIMYRDELKVAQE